jgi:DNA (cytosine-5)-methyltransferase 1
MIKGISLFSGAGGLDVGAELAGVEITHCIEIDHDSAETLRLNSTNSFKKILELDIKLVDFYDMKTTSKMIVFGGPPCQPFSKNGYWVKNENRLIEKDPRNLIDQFMRAVEEVQPTGFLFENVDSILHPSNKAAIERLHLTAKSLGYSAKLYRANSADFGVTQKRKRVFVFGVKGENLEIPDPAITHLDPAKKITDEDTLPLHLGVGKFIEPYSDEKYSEPSEVAAYGTYFHELSNVIPGRNYMSLLNLSNYTGKTFKSGGRFWNFLFKLHPDEPSITIAAQPGPWVGPFHWSNRRLRVPEIAAIQTFPKNYNFHGTRRSIQRQIGNAVPCLLGQKMIEHLLKILP